MPVNLKELIQSHGPEAWLEPLTRALAGAVRETVPIGDSYMTIEALAEGAAAHLSTLEKDTLRQIYWKLGELTSLKDMALAKLEGELTGLPREERIKNLSLLLTLFEMVEVIRDEAGALLGMPRRQRESSHLSRLLSEAAERVVSWGVFPMPYLRLHYTSIERVAREIKTAKGDLFAIKRVEEILRDPTGVREINLRGLSLGEQRFLDELLWIYSQKNPQMDGAPVFFKTSWAYASLGLGPSERKAFRRTFFRLGRRTFTLVIRTEDGGWLVAEEQLYTPLAAGKGPRTQVLGFRLNPLLLSSAQFKRFFPIYPRLRAALPPKERLSAVDYSLIRWLHMHRDHVVRISVGKLWHLLGGSITTWERNRGQAVLALERALWLAERAGYVRSWTREGDTLIIERDASLFPSEG